VEKVQSFYRVPLLQQRKNSRFSPKSRSQYHFIANSNDFSKVATAVTSRFTRRRPEGAKAGPSARKMADKRYSENAD